MSVAIAVPLICTATLLVASRRPSRWHVTFAPNSGIYTADSLEPQAGGLRVATGTTHSVGPLSISAAREWTQPEAHPEIGTRFRELKAKGDRRG